MAVYKGASVSCGDVRIWTESFAGEGPVCLLVGGAGAISAFWPDALCEELASAGYRGSYFGILHSHDQLWQGALGLDEALYRLRFRLAGDHHIRTRRDSSMRT